MFLYLFTVTVIISHGNIVDDNTSTTMIIEANIIKEVSFTLFKGIGTDHDEDLS
jgi:hypothetical protein